MLEEFDVSNLSLVELFNIEVKAQAVVLNEHLLALETNADPQSDLASLMRSAHCIKGAARIIQLEPIVNLAHVMEDCFVAAQSGKITLTADDIDVLLQTVDKLQSVAEVVLTNPDGVLTPDENISSLVNAISCILEPETAPQSKIQLEENQQTILVESSSETTAENVIPHRAVRISAENLNRLMGLAGESLVMNNWLEPFANSLLNLRANQAELSNLIDKLGNLLSKDIANQQIQETLQAAHHTANKCQEMMSDRHNAIEMFCQRSANLSHRLYQEVIATHMCSFADGGQGLPRLVRDLARKLGKRVKLEIVGKSTLIDRDILERLEVPLTHIISNAIDHGIEPPAERLAAGKPEVGTITIEVIHRGGMLFITISDDGRGIDLEFLRQEIVRKQLTNAKMAAQLTELELMEFLFLPGFSTSQALNAISGRGVGLDIANSTVREIGGTLRAVSTPGKGMSLYLQLPLTLSVVRTLLVEIAGEAYAFGLTRIEQVLMLPRSDIALSENCPFFLLNDQPVVLILAHQVLDLPLPTKNPDTLSVIVISDRINHYGLVVDRLLGESSLVVRPLDPRLGKIPHISAAALLDNGSPVLIVDIEDLVNSIGKVLGNGQINQVNQPVHDIVTKNYKSILVVDDSITVREMERKLLENNGYKVEVAVNGVDAWNAVRSGNYDLVVTDIDMPRMNGFELTNQIKIHAKLKHTPVIIVSYKDREQDRLKGLEAGADYYLTKSSFHDETLVNAVVDLIGEA
jgi:two-component system, chemotaxis family, sensor histidine kinase and response regulator WspE